MSEKDNRGNRRPETPEPTMKDLFLPSKTEAYIELALLDTVLLSNLMTFHNTDVVLLALGVDALIYVLSTADRFMKFYS